MSGGLQVAVFFSAVGPKVAVSRRLAVTNISTRPNTENDPTATFAKSGCMS